MKRDMSNKVIAGVCSGLANYFQVDPVLVRVGFVLSFLLWGVGPIIYLLLWIFMKPNTAE